MAQTLTVCRAGTGWAFRDVTGALYGHSPNLKETLEIAQHVAARAGSQVVLSAEALEHSRSSASAEPVDSETQSWRLSRPRFGSFWARLGQVRRRK